MQIKKKPQVNYQGLLLLVHWCEEDQEREIRRKTNEQVHEKVSVYCRYVTVLVL